MRYLLLFVLLVGLAGLAGADQFTTGNTAPDKDTYIGDGAVDGREGGEGFGDAVVIPSLPYADTGATCDNVQDIAISCTGGGPDVVYSYTATGSDAITVSLCGSGYDTALAIFDSGYLEIACNDDACGLQSELVFAPTAGQQYYFVVSAYGGDCGSYTLNVFIPEQCDPTCPDGALQENEPDCYDGYVDATNGGCNSTPNVFGIICPQEENTAIMCGTGGNFDNGSTRDTDWFRVYGDGGLMTGTVCASFPVQFIFIYGTNCSNLQYDLLVGNAFEEVTLSRNVSEGVEAWMWVGTSGFSGTPCGSPYTLAMDGIFAGEDCEPVPVIETNWGGIKSIYR